MTLDLPVEICCYGFTFVTYMQVPNVMVTDDHEFRDDFGDR